MLQHMRKKLFSNYITRNNPSYTAGSIIRVLLIKEAHLSTEMISLLSLIVGSEQLIRWKLKAQPTTFSTPINHKVLGKDKATIPSRNKDRKSRVKDAHYRAEGTDL